jgi:hypothetical protein
MAKHSPKVEVFQLSILSPDEKINFQDLMKRLISKDASGNVFYDFFNYFINKLDTEKYYTDKKKAMTVYKQNLSTDSMANETITLHSNEHIIQGIVKGGIFGRKRFNSNINSKDEITEIPADNVIGDDFFFLLYTPLDFHSGILIIQSYQDSSIRDIFLKFIKLIDIIPISFYRSKNRILPQKVIGIQENTTK